MKNMSLNPVENEELINNILKNIIKSLSNQNFGNHVKKCIKFFSFLNDESFD